MDRTWRAPYLLSRICYNLNKQKKKKKNTSGKNNKNNSNSNNETNHHHRQHHLPAPVVCIASQIFLFLSVFHSLALSLSPPNTHTHMEVSNARHSAINVDVAVYRCSQVVSSTRFTYYPVRLFVLKLQI